MRNIAKAALLVLAASTGACYRNVIETGRPAGTTTIERPFTSTFLFGLVPAAEINTAAQCPQGVARVQTEATVVNSLVAIVTFGIYTPRSVTITCASGTGSLEPTDRVRALAASATIEEREAAVRAAIDESAASGARVFVTF